jgi:hypothetical protein
VLVNWGHRRKDASLADKAVAGVIAAAGADHAAASPTAAPAVAPRQPGHIVGGGSPQSSSPTWTAAFLWCVFALTVALIALRLLHACGPGDERWPDSLRALLPQYCVVERGAQADDDGVAMIEAQIRADELAIARKIAGCDAACRAPARPSVEMPIPRIQEEIVRRLPADVERGPFEISLTWDGASDLDLHVTCPDGSKINFENMAACGGRLVVDANSGGGSPQSHPAEHIIWSNGAPPRGSYRVSVGLYNRYGDTRPRIPFQIAIWRDGNVVREVRGEAVTERTLTPVLTLTLPLE